MGKTEITVNDRSQRLEITQFVFIDDLESAIIELGYPFQHLGTSKELSTADSLIHLYIDTHLSITQGKSSTNQQLQFVGKEISDDLTGLFIYFTQEIDPNSDTSSYIVTNTTLIEQFDDQVNLIYFTYANGAKDYFVLNRKSSTKIVDK